MKENLYDIEQAEFNQFETILSLLQAWICPFLNKISIFPLQKWLFFVRFKCSYFKMFEFGVKYIRFRQDYSFYE